VFCGGLAFRGANWKVLNPVEPSGRVISASLPKTATSSVRRLAVGDGGGGNFTGLAGVAVALGESSQSEETGEFS
jgi:hypothetical protein